jgi:L-alanine-DL-glutamate epimerase-like enolase superfamily enzyme
MEKISRRSFLSTAALSASALHQGCGKSKPDKPKSVIKDFRSYPLQDIERENITITDIKVTPLSYVHKGDYLWRCAGLYVWKADAALCQVFTNQGLVGIAEGSPYRNPANLKEYTDKYIKPRLLGRNVFDADFLTDGQAHNSLAEGAWAGVNNALWDIIGKAKGEPVYKLLSNVTNPANTIPLYASGGVSHAWYDDGETELIEEALKHKENGFDTFKFRNGTSWEYSGMTLEKYIPILRRLREAVGPDFKLCLEKFPWEFDDIISILCPALEDLKFYWYEEPVAHNARNAIDEHLAINEAMPSVMVSGGENFWNRFQVQPFVVSGAMNIIQTDCNLSGISEGWHIGQIVHHYGQRYCPHNWVGGLSTIANAHLAAGVPSGHMCELNQTFNPLKWDIFKEPYHIENGVMTIPDKPGYGVELIDNIEQKFPWTPGPYYKKNPVFEDHDLPIWWSGVAPRASV